MVEIKLEDGLWVVYENGVFIGKFESMVAAANEVDRLRNKPKPKGDNHNQNGSKRSKSSDNRTL